MTTITESLESIWSLLAGEPDRVANLRRIAALKGYTPAQVEAFLDEDEPGYRQEEETGD